MNRFEGARGWRGRMSGEAWLLVGLLLCVCPLFVLGLGSWPLFDSDEGRYAGIPREMLERHDWVTPTLNHIKFFDKPPLLYWGIAASFSIFGLHDWVARLVPMLAGLLGLLMAFLLGRRMFGPRAGLLSALVLATSLMWPLLARVVVTDMLVSSLVFSALALWWLGHTAREQKKSFYFILFWIALALGVLAKGAVAVVLCGGSIFLYLLICKQWSALREMRWMLGLPLFVAIAVPWFVVVAMRNPEFNYFFRYQQHFARFVGHGRMDRDHVQSSFYLVQLLPAIFFPWSALAPAALIAGYKYLRAARSEKHSRIYSEKQRSIIYLLCGCAFIVLFFSSSDSKLVTYILPVLPLLAILMAAYLDRLWTRREVWSRSLTVGAGLLSLVLFVGVAVGLARGQRALIPFEVSTNFVPVLAALLGLWAIAVAVATWRARVGELVGAVAGGFAVAISGAFVLVSAMAPRMTATSIVEHIRPGLERGGLVATQDLIQSVGYYTRSRVYMLGKSDELTYGIQHMAPSERQKWILEGPDDLRRLMAQPVPVYFWTRDFSAEHARFILANIGSGAAEIARNKRYIVFGNAQAVRLTPPQSP